jgi:cytochrome d ubiquinol oxidase subunit I
VVVLGDESGYTLTEHQKMKIAVIEAMWDTEPAPAGLVVFGLPDLETRETHYEVKIPWLLGLIATRSFTEEMPGINDLVASAERRIRNGMIAYDALKQVRANPENAVARAVLEEHVGDLGYALLLKRYTENVAGATEEEIRAAAWDTVPAVAPLFWSFRFMAGLGFYFILLFVVAFYLTARRRFRVRWFLWIALISLPLPWIAAELGWFVAEYGRQPWAIYSVLPTFLGASSISAGQVWFSLAGFVLFYSVLAVLDVYLMVKYIRMGPEGPFPGKSRPTRALAAEPGPGGTGGGG